MRPLSAAALRAMLAQQTPEDLRPFLEISHASFSAPILATCNAAGQDVSAGGKTYVYYPFEVTLPGEYADKLASVTLRIDNVSDEIVVNIRGMKFRDGPATVSLFAALASTPDQVEYGPVELKLRKTSVDQLVVAGELRDDDLLNERYPAHSFTPNLFPGMFK
jgi:hypothetical protein